MMTGDPDYEQKVLSTLQRLLGHRDELKADITKLFHSLQMHETQTVNQFLRIDDTLKGVCSRITHLEGEAEDTGQYRVAELAEKLEAERAKSDKILGVVLKSVGAALMAAFGALVSWLLKR